jgi:hypothetical protein
MDPHLRSHVGRPGGVGVHVAAGAAKYSASGGVVRCDLLLAEEGGCVDSGHACAIRDHEPRELAD